MTELKPCPFCGGKAHICGERYRQYFDGEWCEAEGEKYWVETRCKINCIYGNTKSEAFGVIGGIEYTTPEAAAIAWNRRAEERVMPFGAFSVVDTKTGKYPDLQKIALKEDWAKGLMYCDMEGFAISEDGCLYLMDECGNMVVCPEGRFRVVEEDEE